MGFGSLMAAEASKNPLAPKAPHFPAKAKSMIFLFQAGGPSHLETFDPKPLLNKLHGEKRPDTFGKVEYQNVNSASRLLGTKRTFARYGKSGLEVSDLLPHQAQIADDLCVIRSMHGDMVVHSAAQYQLMSGRVIPGFPSMGSWVTYGLTPSPILSPPTSSCPTPTALPKPASPCTRTAFCPPSTSPPCSAPASAPS